MRYLGLLMVVFFIAGCRSNSDDTVIHLSNLQPLPVQAEKDITPLRISVGAVISPRGTVESYRPFIDYLSAKLDRPVELLQRRTYTETNQLIEESYVDIAFVCTSAYIIGHATFGMELIAAPQVNGVATYQSLLIVPANSPAQSIADLADKVFAFTDPISFSGRVYPTYLVKQLGRTPEEFFARTFFTYSHDHAIHAVAEGLADGAAVDSLVYDFALERDPSLLEAIRIIHQSPDFAIPPVVANPDMRPQLKATLQNILFHMHEDAEGQQVLANLGVERFIPVEDLAYNSIRDVIEAVGPLSE